MVKRMGVDWDMEKSHKVSLLAAATTVDASILLENEEIVKMLHENQSLENLIEYVEENF